MAVTLKQVRAALDPEEPDYAAAGRLGPEALPHLRRLVASKDTMLASKAVHLAALVGGDDAVDVVQQAAEHANPVLRVAAAAATRELPPPAAARVLPRLLADDDRGVRKVALNSVPPNPGDEVMRHVRDLEQLGADPGLQAAATSARQRSRRPRPTP
jgi:HEAT repeat protein